MSRSSGRERCVWLNQKANIYLTPSIVHTCWILSAGVIKDPTTVMLAIVLTGLEEVIMRSTMVERDNFFRWLQGLPEPTEDELKLQQRMWSASTAMAM